MHVGPCTYTKSRLCWRMCFCFSRLAHRKLGVLDKLGGRFFIVTLCRSDRGLGRLYYHLHESAHFHILSFWHLLWMGLKLGTQNSYALGKDHRHIKI